MRDGEKAAVIVLTSMKKRLDDLEEGVREFLQEMEKELADLETDDGKAPDDGK